MPESQNIEYKAAWRDEYLKWVCCFANAQGGVIFIGKDDNGKIVSVARMTPTRDLTDLVEKEVLKSSATKGAGSYYEL